MTLQEIPSESFRERSIPVLETERLVLRAPRLGDAKTIAVLANDRRIAENTARIAHPYRLADAEDFIASANLGNEAAFFITLRNGALIGSKMSDALTVTVALTPVFIIRPLSAAAGKTMSIDYVAVSALRV